MFKGFSPRSSELFWELGFNNNREWFRENRGALDTYLLVPFRELAEDTFALFREKVPAMDPVLHVSRIYRDARRLFGRGPYKDNLWFSIRSGGTTGDEVSFFFEKLLYFFKIIHN